MNISFFWPPEKIFTGSLFKHYTYFGETIGYILSQGFKVNIYDCGVKQYSYQELYYVIKESDIIVMYIEIYNILSANELISFIKQINDEIPVIVYGTACCYIPKYICAKMAADAVVYNSNWETAIRKFIEYCYSGKKVKCYLSDIYIRNEENQIIKCPEGELLKANEWGFPPLDILPMQDYFRVRGKRQIEISVNKGCGYNCSFCSERNIYGKIDYRRDIDSILEYLENISIDYDNIYFDSTTFTFNEKWVYKLCKEMSNCRTTYRWRTVTRIDAVNEELLFHMRNAGCYKISFGIETLSSTMQEKINKRIGLEKIEKVFNACNKFGIIPRALIIIGLPGQTRNDFVYTYRKLKEMNCEIRVKEYLPYNEILKDESLTLEIVKRFDRSKFYPENVVDMPPSDYMSYIFEGRDA